LRNQPTFLHDVYTFSGTPYEIGFQSGKLAADELKRRVDGFVFGNPYLPHLWPEPGEYSLDALKERFPDKFKRWEKAHEDAPEWFREECRGKADGAGVDYEKIIVTTTFIPFVMQESDAAFGSAEDDCNGFVAHGKATVDGKPLVGGNGETDHLAIRQTRIVRMRNKVGNSFVMKSGLPFLNSSQAGMNDKGVCLFGSGVSIKPEIFGDVGYRQVIRRIVLQEADNVDEAIDLFKQGPLMGGQHIYLADKKRAVHIEYAGKHVEVIEPESGFDAGSSPYFSSPRMTPHCNVLVDETDPRFSWRVAKKRGVFRMERWHELYEKHKPLSLEKMPTLLGDHGGRGTGLIQEHIEGACPQGSDYTICAHGTRTKSGSFHASHFSNISQPDKLKLWIAAGNPCECGFFPFTPPT